MKKLYCIAILFAALAIADMNAAARDIKNLGWSRSERDERARVLWEEIQKLLRNNRTKSWENGWEEKPYHRLEELKGKVREEMAPFIEAYFAVYGASPVETRAGLIDLMDNLVSVLYGSKGITKETLSESFGLRDSLAESARKFDQTNKNLAAKMKDLLAIIEPILLERMSTFPQAETKEAEGKRGQRMGAQLAGERGGRRSVVNPKDTGWTEADTIKKRTWETFRDLLVKNLAKPADQWSRPDQQLLGILQKQAPKEMRSFLANCVAVFNKYATSMDRKAILDQLDLVASILFGSKPLTPEMRQQAESIAQTLEGTGKKMYDARINDDLAGDIGALAMFIEEILKERGARVEGKQAEAESEKLIQELAALERFVADYIRVVRSGADQKQINEAFETASTNIANLKAVPMGEKNAALTQMMEATPQEPEAQQPAGRPSVQRPEAPKRAAPQRPSVAEQPKRPELRSVEQPKRVEPAVPARPSISKLGATDKQKLSKIQEQFWVAALSHDSGIQASAVPAASRDLEKISSLTENQKKEIIDYMRWVQTLPELPRIQQRRKQREIDVLDTQAWKKQ